MGREGWEEQRGTHRKRGKARRSSEKPGRAVTWDGSAVSWRMDTEVLTANGGWGPLVGFIKVLSKGVVFQHN